MIKKTLTSNRVDQVDNVIHIADVHIRNFKRHDEYESVFQRVYDYCREEVGQNKNTIIYLAGDIVHSKTDMSPELIVQTRNFFVNLARIAPVILISGNHDRSLNNRNRLDALTPIVDSLNVSDFFYLKETGVYTFGGVDFILNAIQDEPENFIKRDQLDSDNIKVVFFHGAIDKSDIGSGNVIRNNKVTISTFNEFDFGMFGDIHSFQYLDPNARFAYAGSLIQQNFGEGLIHGVVHWKLREGTSKFVPIKNDWAYYTIDIDEGKLVNMPKEFSPHNRIRVRSYNTTNSDLFKAITKLRGTVKVDDIRIQKFSPKGTNGQQNTTISMGDVRNVEYQNSLITEYLEKNFPVEEEVLDKIRSINRDLNTQLNKTPVLRNVIWTPIKFEFSNMFSYGEGNEIDFSQMNGTYGIFAQNASGKSSILDSLMFCIFDKCSRTFKASQILNNKKDGFDCKFHFQINGRDYFIQRVGKKDKRGHVKVDVDFWYEENGETHSLNGDDRDGTNFAIRNYLGTYDDFIITAMSLQGNNTNFIDKAQRERKDLLAQFLDLNLFEELNGAANDEIKSVQTLIKEFSRQDYSTKITEANDTYKLLSISLQELNEKKEQHQQRIDSYNEEIMSLTKALKPVDDGLMGHNLEELIEKKAELAKKVAACEWELLEMERELQSLNNDLTVEQEKFDGMDYEDLTHRKTMREFWLTRFTTVQSERSKTHIRITHNQSKIDNLSNHEYDPTCQYCVNNVFVKDAKESETIIIKLQEEYADLTNQLTEIETTLDGIPSPDDELEIYGQLERKIVNAQRAINEIQRKISDNTAKCSDLSNKAVKTEELIHKFVQNEGTIKENQGIQLKIAEIEFKRDDLVSELKGLDRDIIYSSGQVKVAEKTIQDCADSIKKLKELETQFKAYDYYLKAVNRNGVPYELISEALPKVQVEVNSILSQIVEFQILFETDGKSINTYIVYDDQNYWPLEMTSGMEKFISSLAIRTALINVSSLPRPNFIAIDEGWGTLDSDNLNSMFMLFDYIKTQFDFMLTISHIDTMRDIVDSVIEINRENGYSKVTY